jgi:hypothetical protein
MMLLIIVKYVISLLHGIGGSIIVENAESNITFDFIIFLD